MFKHFDEVVSYVGTSMSRHVSDFPRTRLVNSPYGMPNGVVLRYRFNNLITYYPQHIVINTPVTNPNSQGAVRKRVNTFLPPAFKIKNRQGTPWLIVNSTDVGYKLLQGMVLDWEGKILKPYPYKNNLFMDRLDAFHSFLDRGRCPVEFDDTSCFLCGTQSEGQPLYHSLGLDYHFLEHFYDDDPYPAYMLLDICREHEKKNGVARPFEFNAVTKALTENHTFDRTDYEYMKYAFKWFIRDRLGIEVGS